MTHMPLVQLQTNTAALFALGEAKQAEFSDAQTSIIAQHVAEALRHSSNKVQAAMFVERRVGGMGIERVRCDMNGEAAGAVGRRDRGVVYEARGQRVYVLAFGV